MAPSPVSFILLAIGGATVLGFGVSMAAVCWWKEAKKEELEAAAHRGNRPVNHNSLSVFNGGCLS